MKGADVAMMTPRERAEATLDGKAASILNRMDAAHLIDISPSRWGRACAHLRQELDAILAEHVRALLADDEALIEAMDMAYWQGWHDEGGRLGAGTYEFCKTDHSGEMGKAGARAALAVLRRKALGE